MVKRRLLLICAILAVTLACWVPTADAWWGYRSYGCGWSSCYSPCYSTAYYGSCGYGGCGYGWSYRPVSTCVLSSCCSPCATSCCSPCASSSSCCDPCSSCNACDSCDSCGSACISCD